MIARVRAFLAREWSTLSTKIGLVLTAVSTIAPNYAEFDHRIAWAGAVSGALLIVYRGKANA